MAAANPSSLILTAGIVALIAWRIYSRVRRMVGRQKLSRVRPWITVSLFPILLLWLLFSALAHPGSAAAMLIGVVVGAGLGVYGLRLTVFEDTPAGRFYTPNAHLGIALSLVFLGRIAYRVVQLYGVTTPVGSSPDAFVRSPVTLLIFGTLAGYYIAYAVGLLRWSHGLNPAVPTAVADPPKN
jgi:drug/metabolite transporter superfamily protein YnfA